MYFVSVRGTSSSLDICLFLNMEDTKYLIDELLGATKQPEIYQENDIIN